MTPQELRASFGLASIFGLRMLGMFIILPVFALYAAKLPGGSSHTMVGIALGAYGLTQACLQVPFGWLSDRWGRKRTIYLGLVIFALGSFVAALAHDINMVILGRIIQGAGAISAAVIALAADLTRDEQRTKAMAIIGMTIGGTFALSMAAGPVLDRIVGVPGNLRADRISGDRRAACCAGDRPRTPAGRRTQIAGSAGIIEIGVARYAVVAAQLRHIRVARDPDGAFCRGAVRAAGTPAGGQSLACVSAGHAGRDRADAPRHAARRTQGTAETGICRRGGRADRRARPADVVGRGPAGAGGRPAGVLHCLQSARSDTALHDLEAGTGRRQGNRHRRLQLRAIHRYFRGRGKRRLAVATLRHAGSIRFLRHAGDRLAAAGLRHAGPAQPRDAPLSAAQDRRADRLRDWCAACPACRVCAK